MNRNSQSGRVGNIQVNQSFTKGTLRNRNKQLSQANSSVSFNGGQVVGPHGMLIRRPSNASHLGQSFSQTQDLQPAKTGNQFEQHRASMVSQKTEAQIQQNVMNGQPNQEQPFITPQATLKRKVLQEKSKTDNLGQDENRQLQYCQSMKNMVKHSHVTQRRNREFLSQSNSNFQSRQKENSSQMIESLQHQNEFREQVESDIQSFKDSYIKELKQRVKQKRESNHWSKRRIPFVDQNRERGDKTPQRPQYYEAQQIKSNQNSRASKEERSVRIDPSNSVRSPQQTRSNNPFDNISTDEFDCGHEVTQPGEGNLKVQIYNNDQKRDNFIGDLNQTVIHEPTNEESNQKSHVERYLQHVEMVPTNRSSLATRNQERLPYEYGYKSEKTQKRRRSQSKDYDGNNIHNLGGKLDKSQQSKIEMRNKSKESSMMFPEHISSKSDMIREMIQRQPEPEEQSDKQNKILVSEIEQNIVSGVKKIDSNQSSRLVTPQFEPIQFRYERQQIMKENINMDTIVNVNSKTFDPVFYMSKHSIKCRKYHYSIPQNYGDCDAIIHYDAVKDKIKIYHIEHKGRCQNIDGKSSFAQRQANLDGVNSSCNQNRYLSADRVDLKSERFHKLCKANLKFDVNDIEGFIFGSFSTRFWMLKIGLNELIIDNSFKIAKKALKISNRKKIQSKQGMAQQIQNTQGTQDSDQFTGQKNSKEDMQMNEIPFFAWECITIQLKNRDINLVIKDELQMKILILFLIQKLKTYDGTRGSLQLLKDQDQIPKGLNPQELRQKLYHNFLMLKIRMKISYEACVSCRTIQELFLISILKTYKQRVDKGLVECPYPKVSQKLFNGVKKMCIKQLAKSNIELDDMRDESNKKLKSELPNEEYIQQMYEEKQEETNEEYEEQKKFNQRKNKLWKNLTKSVLKIGIIDHMFEKHYDSDGENGAKDMIELVAKEKDIQLDMKKKEEGEYDFNDFQKKQASHSKMNKYYHDENGEDVDEDEETKKFKRRKQNLVYKKRILRDHKQTAYTKIMILVKLRVLQGPLFIYALLECIKLCKQIFILELEQGREVCIPYMLDMKHLPLSFQYYDCMSEFVRMYISSEQMSLIYNSHQIEEKQNKKAPSKAKDDFKIKDVKLSFNEKVQRFFAKLCNSNGGQDTDEEDYKHKLKLYQKSHAIQSARYVQINKDIVKLKIPNENQKQFLKQTDDYQPPIDMYRLTGSVGSKEQQYGTPNKGLRTLSTNKLVKLKEIKSIDEEMFNHPNLQVDIQYLTHKQIGRKRANLFRKKLQYQNQLTSLKEKGKRLIMSDKLDKELRSEITKLQTAMCDHCDQEVIHNIHKENVYEVDAYLKEKVQDLEQFIKLFSLQGIFHSEEHVAKIRLQLMTQLRQMEDFNEQNRHIDNKIMYDQRFFNDGYQEFQSMISDIRKQTRLNQEVIRLRNQLTRFCEKVDENEEQQREVAFSQGVRFDRSATLIERKNKCNDLQKQYDEQRLQLQALRDASQKNTQAMMDNMKYKGRTQLDQNDDQGQRDDSPALPIGARSSGVHRESYVKYMDMADSDVKIAKKSIPERSASDIEEREPSWKRSSKTITKGPADAYREIEQIVEEISESDSLDYQNQKNQRMQNRQIKKQDRVRPPPNAVHLQVPGIAGQRNWAAVDSDEEEEDDFEDDTSQLLSKQHKHASDPVEKASGLDASSKQPFGKLAQSVFSAKSDPEEKKSWTMGSLLWQSLSNKIKDMSDPDEMERMEQLMTKIQRRRSKIKYVSKESQVSLWGKKGSYEPSQYRNEIQAMEGNTIWSQLHKKIDERIKSSVVVFPPKQDVSSDDRSISPRGGKNLTERQEAQQYFNRESNTVAQTHGAVLRNAYDDREDSYTFKER